MIKNKHLALLHGKFLYRAKYVGQIFKTFLVFSTRFELIIVDQHAAHEQILFEKFIRDYENCKINNKYIIPNNPICIKIDKTQSRIINHCLLSIKKIGINLHIKQNLTVSITSYLVCYSVKLIPRVFSVFFNISYEKTGFKTFEIRFLKQYFQLRACKMSIRMGDTIKARQASTLQAQLNELINNSYCPHGRPIMQVISINDFLRNFFRSTNFK